MELPEEERLLPEERTLEEPELLDDELPEELRTAVLREGLAAVRDDELALRDTEPRDVELRDTELRDTELREELPARLTLLRTEPAPKADAEEVLRAML